ncbi:hypothetical protein M422DRAFT_241327 [Sphaerobolus stellatus SS14]|nr:hypothetical protein M422DRAFT_241327 [Sphaerobolus stellatus SS14]
MNPRPPKGYRFPPGPRGKPFIGELGTNLNDLSLLRKWRKKYGDIISFHILGNRHVIIFSKSIASDLFEKRSFNYSDRHPQPVPRLQGWEYNPGFMPYGDWWRRHRRGFHQFFNAGVVKDYEPAQLQATIDLVARLHATPKDFVNHLEYFTASIIMKVVYNYTLQDKNDSFVDIVRVAVEGVTESVTIGSFLVDFLPFLEYVPEWFPGAGWKRRASYFRTSTVAINTVPYEMVKKNIERGTAGPSITAAALARLQSKSNALPDDEEVLRNVSGVSYAAGAGTVKDREHLPYTNAFCEETQRWRPVVPLAAAHAASEDDTYGDYFIPKGTIVIGDGWEIMRDETLYGPNAEDFNPDRFFKAGVTYPSAQWGYGRRMCPGRHLASNTLFLAAATILKLFDVVPAKDEQGNDIPISGEYAMGGFIAPKPFQCEFKPRSDFARTFLKENAAPTDN